MTVQSLSLLFNASIKNKVINSSLRTKSNSWTAGKVGQLRKRKRDLCWSIFTIGYVATHTRCVYCIQSDDERKHKRMIANVTPFQR